MFSLTIADKQVSVFPGRQAEQPVIYLHTFAAEGNAVADLLRCGSSQRCSLVTIGGLDWQHDMVPWDSPALNAQDAPFTGGADSYLHLLGEQIIPAVENLLPQPPSWRGLVGYSLAGLFTLYALYRSDYFSCAASVSGSLWFPGLSDYISAHQLRRRPKRLYFSLGEKEHLSRNPSLQAVRRCTEQIAAWYRRQGITVKLEFNPGNHFQQAPERIAAAIEYLLSGEA